MSGSGMVPVADYLSKHKLSATVEKALNELYAAQAANPAQFLAEHFAKLAGPTLTIDKIVGREILDSRGNPTVEADVIVGGKFFARASAPSGASTGSNEAREIRDGDKSRYLGKGVLKAVEAVSGPLSAALSGKTLFDLRALDQAMQEADGTELKEKLGGNAITAASFAVAEAGAKAANVELFEFLARNFHASAMPTKFSLPRPLVNILNGGKHAGGKLKIQEFMIVPRGDIEFKETIRIAATVYHHLGKILVERFGVSAKNLGDEGGYAPAMENAEQALDAIETAVKAAGFTLGRDGDVALALDCASTEFWSEETKMYEIEEGKWISTDDMITFYEQMIEAHPALISIEDGLAEADYEGWAKLTARLGSKVMLVGDDLYTTNPRFIRQGIENKWATALLLKVNQIGTISEAMDAARMEFEAGHQVIVSHRSGETGTNLIADLAVGIGAGFIKTGSCARGERIGKYNRLLEIEDYLKERNMLQIRSASA